MIVAPYESIFENEYFSKDLAVGEARILTDTIFFRFRDEEFEFPSKEIHHLVTHNPSSFMTMRVEELRALQKERKADG